MTIFCLRDNLYRDAAPVTFTSFIYREKYPAIYQTCTATAPAPNKPRTRTAKSAPYLPCTGTNSRLKYQDSARMLRQVTLTTPTTGPLATKFAYKMNFLLTINEDEKHTITCALSSSLCIL
jgi:hypothetical protein